MNQRTKFTKARIGLLAIALASAVGISAQANAEPATKTGVVDLVVFCAKDKSGPVVQGWKRKEKKECKRAFNQ